MVWVGKGIADEKKRKRVQYRFCFLSRAGPISPHYCYQAVIT